ncbi:MAG TPA: plasmid partition protein ParG [Mycobacteriales bacterium]|nr:plasmid partition protein ParG [Mycobacteriales bacterium]
MADDPDPIKLLLKAVGRLPDEERDVVLAYLLERGLGPQASRPAPALAAPGFIALSGATEPPGFRSARASTGGELQMVPVRFPADQHQRLRAWCGDHGFTMATVVRGLVDQFLDTQQMPPGFGTQPA